MTFQNHIPARGRKRSCQRGERAFVADFKTTSPQGDGNSKYSCFIGLPAALISKPHPRKGTETPSQKIPYLQHLLQISKPHPRKGTECTNPSLPCRSGGGGPCEAWWKGRLERSTHLHREKVTSATSAPTGSHRSPPPPFRRGRRIEHIPARGRKLENVKVQAAHFAADFKTTSPQGDGVCEPQPPLPQRGRGTMRSMVEGAP